MQSLVTMLLPSYIPFLNYNNIFEFHFIFLNSLAIAIGLFIDLGTSNDLGFVYNLTCLEHTPLKGCTYTPLHMLQFFVILILLILLIYGQLVVISLYVMIKVSVIVAICHENECFINHIKFI